MLSKPSQGQVMALAGLFQCCALVDELARSGNVPGDQLEVCLESLFINSLNPADVFGSGSAVSHGIATLQRLITIDSGTPQAAVIRYAIGAIQLAGKLQRNSKMLRQIGSRLEETQRMREHFPLIHENIINNLAQLYQDTISTLSHRIQVNGFAANLQQPAVAARIRCLLFAAIRCAILWRRNGGSKRHLLFNRKQILNLLKQLPA